MPYSPKTHSELQKENSPFKEFYAEYEKQKDLKRGTSKERGYDAKWRQIRAYHLKHNPLCVYCLKNGITKQATVVDHIQAHKGNKTLFYDTNNLQSLCSVCHNSTKKKEENKNRV